MPTTAVSDGYQYKVDMHGCIIPTDSVSEIEDSFTEITNSVSEGIPETCPTLDEIERALEQKRRTHWLYCDIDGTLTEAPNEPWGKPRLDVIWKLKDQIAAGAVVVLWSASGQEYAEEFAARYGIRGLKGCMAKPSVIVDDNKMIRDEEHCPRLSPEEFLRW